MRNTKGTYLFWAICLTCFILMQSDTKGEKQTEPDFGFVKADKYFVPSANETIAILFEPIPIIGDNDCNICSDDYNNICYMLALFGDKKNAEKIIGRKLEPMKLIEGRGWLEKIIDEYDIALTEAEEKGLDKQYGIMSKIVFITRNKGYIRNVTFKDSDDVFYDEYMKSNVLRDYFETLGFIPIEPHQAEEYVIPPKDETVAILLYRYQSRQRGPCIPVAIFGDKKLAEKLLYGDKEMMEKILYVDRNGPEKGLDGFVPGETLEPKKVFEGREWLERIMDAYEVALEEIKEMEKKEIKGYKHGALHDGSIVFVTQNAAYTREIKVGESAIRDDDMDSEQLKEYFDELGLTEELLAEEPTETEKN
ncbi:MAG: hypothetical protein PHY02_08075 [Phycisphaerae bacterium]|nr:hypothetical protein [Phycisphaerae bacterium]